MIAAYVLILFTALLLTQYLFGFFQGKRKGIAKLGRSLVDRLDFTPESLGGRLFLQLAIVSFISMFLELMMIRWVSSEIRIFAFFKNFVLVACFFGFGIGCHFSRRKINVAALLFPMIYLVVLMKLPWRQLRDLMAMLPLMLGSSSNLQVWNVPDFDAGWLLRISALAVASPIFIMIALMFVPLGQMIGWYLENSPTGLSAYSINVGASLLGILAFATVSFLDTTPSTWLGIVAVCLIWLFWSRSGFCVASVAALLVCAALAALPAQNGGTTYWSPYQKLTVTPVRQNGELTSYELNTNDTWYQHIINLSPEFVGDHPSLFPGHSQLWNSYNLPYWLFAKPSSVLVLGAGMGNDVAAAIRNTQASVVAVEIDPTIIRLGRALHFERPYDSPRVRVVIDDARSYIHNTPERFDLVMFSLLDSHTTNSNFTNIRIDNYVYTVEALREARLLLNPNGLMIVKFQTNNAWIAGRLEALLTQVFGQKPLQVQVTKPTDGSYASGGRFFVSGSESRIREALRKPEVAAYVAEHGAFPSAPAPVITDDWPYFYQREPGIPMNVILMSALVALLSFWFVRKTGCGSLRLEWHFFLLGAGFLLLEVQIVSKIALLFGTTWLVNAFVISTLLLLIMAANWTVQAFPRLSVWPAYLGILLSGLLAYFLPVEAYFFESMALRVACAMAVLCSPAYFAGIVFARSYAASRFSSGALGSNILGALCGGILESLSLWTGVRSLVLLALVLYLFSALALKASERAEKPILEAQSA